MNRTLTKIDPVELKKHVAFLTSDKIKNEAKYFLVLRLAGPACPIPASPARRNSSLVWQWPSSGTSSVRDKHRELRAETHRPRTGPLSSSSALANETVTSLSKVETQTLQQHQAGPGKNQLTPESIKIPSPASNNC